MTSWIVSRHAGALTWLRRHGLNDGHEVSHLDVAMLQPGDRVIGTLPVHLVAEVWDRGARYYHLRLPVEPQHRGRELSADELDALGATLECYFAEWRPSSLNTRVNTDAL